MFETESFQAFNTFSLANLKCLLKFNATDTALSMLTIEYYFGLTEKYEISISESNLSYDMMFVVGNLKGFYQYLRSIHDQGKFKLCQMNKNIIKITFLLKTFNQERIIQQEFNSTLLNDKVIWKSEFKNQIDNIEKTLSIEMTNNINRKVKNQMNQQKQRSILKINALDTKITRELEVMKQKLQMVVKMVNNGTKIIPQTINKVVQHRGGYKQDQQPKRNDNSRENNDRRRIIRRSKIPQKTKIISKLQNSSSNIQQKQKRKYISQSIKQSEKINKINQEKVNNQKKYDNQKLSILKVSSGRKVEQFKRLPLKYQRNHNNNQRMSQKIIQQKNQIHDILSKRQIKPNNRTQKLQQKTQINQKMNNKDQTLHSFLIKKDNNVESENFTTPRKHLRQIIKLNPLQINILSQLESRRKKSPNQKLIFSIQKNQNIQKSKEKDQIISKKINGTSAHHNDSHQQKQIKSIITKDLINERKLQINFKKEQNQSMGLTKQSDMIDQKYENLHQDENALNIQNIKNPTNLSNQSLIQKQKKAKNNSNQNYINQASSKKQQKPSRNSELENHLNQTNNSSVNSKSISQGSRRAYFQKNMKNLQVIDLENDQQLKKIIIRIKQKIGLDQNQKIIKYQQEVLSNSKKPVLNGKQDESKTKHINKIQNHKESKVDLNKKNQANQHKFSEKYGSLNLNNQSINKNQNKIILQKQQSNSESVLDEVSKMARIVESFKKNKREESKISMVKYHGEKKIKTKHRKLFTLEEENRHLSGKHFWTIRILRSQNYHICMGIVDMPSEIKINNIPKNCDALYLLDGGLHDEAGGSNNQNGWRVKEGQSVDVLQMELQVQKGDLYVIMLVDMDKQQIFFYYNDKLISKTTFSFYCRKNKKRLHPYLALRNQNDCIQIV